MKLNWLEEANENLWGQTILSKVKDWFKEISENRKPGAHDYSEWFLAYFEDNILRQEEETWALGTEATGGRRT